MVWSLIIFGVYYKCFSINFHNMLWPWPQHVRSKWPVAAFILLRVARCKNRAWKLTSYFKNKHIIRVERTRGNVERCDWLRECVIAAAVYFEIYLAWRLTLTLSRTHTLSEKQRNCGSPPLQSLQFVSRLAPTPPRCLCNFQHAVQEGCIWLP